MSEPEEQSANKPLPESMRTREPWPMWPIALAIVAFIGIYTWVQLEFRKDGPAFEPAQAMEERKNAIAAKNFYDWYSLKTEKADNTIELASKAQATSRAYPQVLEHVIPEQLKYYMSTRPVLLPGFVKTESPTELTPGEPLPIRLSIPPRLVDNDLLQILSFYKEGELYILATLYIKSIEELDQTLLEGETVPTTFLIPTGPIAAETVKVSFLNSDRLSQWEITNLDPSAADIEEDEKGETTPPEPTR